MARPFYASDLLDIPEFVEQCQRDERASDIERWIRATYGEERTPSRATVERAKRLARQGGAVAPSVPVVPVVEVETPAQPYKLMEAPTGATVESPVAGRIISLDDLLAAAKVDLVAWRVDRFVVNKWEVGTKGPDGNTVVAPLFQVKAWLLPNVAALDLVALKDELLQEMTRHAPRYSPVIYPPRSTKERYLLEVSPFDLHLAKLGWGAETGAEDYDSKIAERVLLQVVEDAIQKTAPFQPERILLPLGNDFFHTDTPENTTRRGTRQDVDTRHHKMFSLGRRIAVALIDRLQLIAPVDVVIVPGNHDETLAFMLGEVLEAWYRQCPNVTVDNTPTLRKYYRWGKVLIGLSHGCNEKHADLPMIMAHERPQDWAETTTHEWHTGHLHIKRETRYLAANTYKSVVVRVLTSLSGQDAWHTSQGYIDSPRALESLLFSHETGIAGQFSSNYFEGAQ